MTVKDWLLEKLQCPVTRQPIRQASREELDELNARIASGGVQYGDGTAVDKPLDEGLVTRDGSRIYRVDDGIPIMLAEKVIRVESPS